MSKKRFTDANKWMDPWFRRLPTEHKLLWLFILDHCDSAGVWIVDLDLAGFFLGYTYTMDSVLIDYADRIKVFDDGKKWWIKKFVYFQYGELRPETCRPHQSHASLLKRHGLWIDYLYTIDTLSEKSERAKEKEKEKEEEKEGECEGEIEEAFCRFWGAWPEKKHKKSARKSFKKAMTVTDVDIILAAVDAYKSHVASERKRGFDLNYCGPEVWLNQERWNDEYPEQSTVTAEQVM